MANIFTLENFDNDFSEKINIDDLYEKKHKYDINKLTLYKKILNRVHVKIKTISKYYIFDRCCWYVVPEVMIGIPKYDQGGCIAYIMDALEKNGFKTKYFHPNTILISWEHWVPSYVRNEIKKKTGLIIDENGERVEQTSRDSANDNSEYSPMLLSNESVTDPSQVKNSKKYTPITSYKPSGNLIYNKELLNKIENKIK